MDPTVEAILGSWHWRADVIVVLGGLGAAYVSGWWRLRQRNSRGVETWRLALYLTGVSALALALLSPVDTLASVLFVVHMSQHELLTMVAPPLLLLGNPLPVVLWGLPAAWRQRAGRLLAPGTRVRRTLWALTLMAVTWLLYVATIWGWHWPPVYGASLRSALIHDVQHLTLFATATLFWWPILDPAPRLHGHIHHAVRLAYVVPAAFQSQALGLILAFFPTLLYPHYAGVPRLWGYTALEDQSIAGVLMMQFEGLVYLLVILVLVARMLSYEERRTLLGEQIAQARRRAPGPAP